MRKKEIDWFYQRGASFLFPDAWEHYLAPIPEDERGDLLHAYHRRLTSDDPAVRQEAARAWSVWEGSTSTLFHDPALCADCRNKLCIEICSGQALMPGPEATPAFDREKCIHCGACYWSCTQPLPGQPDRTNLRFRAGSGGLHSTEN